MPTGIDAVAHVIQIALTPIFLLVGVNWNTLIRGKKAGPQLSLG